MQMKLEDSKIKHSNKLDEFKYVSNLHSHEFEMINHLKLELKKIHE